MVLSLGSGEGPCETREAVIWLEIINERGAGKDGKEAKKLVVNSNDNCKKEGDNDAPDDSTSNGGSEKE